MKPITIGTRVHSILYGGRDGTVVAIHGEARPETIITFPGLVTGGNAEYDIIWDSRARSMRIPESIIRGVQWRLLDQPPVPQDQIEIILQQAAAKDEADRIAAEQKRIDKAKRRQEFIDQHPELEVGEGYKIAAKNLRKQLRAAFPTTKFSVRSDYNSIRVEWEAGPTEESVMEITRNYKAGRFDGMSDCYEYNHDRAWPFGDVQYVFETRSYAPGHRDHAIALMTAWFVSTTPADDIARYAWQAYHRTTIPKDHDLTCIETQGAEFVFTTAPATVASPA